MQHEPSNCHISISQALKESFDVVQNVVFQELAIDHVAVESLEAILDHESILLSDGLDVAKVNVVLDSLSSGWKRLPVLGQISQISLVNLNHKVVRKVLVSNFSHFSLLVL